MSIQISGRKTLSVFTLAMINVIAVDNLRSLTVGAEFGFALVFFYLLAALLFFIPCILVTAELATGWPTTGGVYVWVREAFGLRFGFLTIWLQWIYNVVWYPTIFAFIAGVIAYLINPALASNKFYMLSVILLSFWSATFINCLGLKASNIITVSGAILGTMIPMVLISILGIIWLCSGKPSQVIFSAKTFMPSLTHIDNLAFLTNILFGVMGMEMSAVHAGDVKNPRRDYPRALAYSGIIILFTLILASLAIAIVVPVKELNLVSGLIDAYKIFFHNFHLDWLAPVIAILIILGGLSGATAWIMGPARGLLIASVDCQLPKVFTKINARQMPVGILFIQGIVATLLCAVFLIMPTVNSSYWILSNLTAQLALIFYLFMFAAAIRLRYKHPQINRAFQIPGGKFGIWVVGLTGIIVCLSAIILGFLPPGQVAVGHVFQYETILIGGMLVLCLPPLFLYQKKIN